MGVVSPATQPVPVVCELSAGRELEGRDAVTRTIRSDPQHDEEPPTPQAQRKRRRGPLGRRCAG